QCFKGSGVLFNSVTRLHLQGGQFCASSLRTIRVPEGGLKCYPEGLISDKWIRGVGIEHSTAVVVSPDSGRSSSDEGQGEENSANFIPRRKPGGGGECGVIINER